MADPITPAPTPAPKQSWILRVYHSQFVQLALDSIGQLVGAHPQQLHCSPMDIFRACLIGICLFVSAKSGLLVADPSAAAGIGFAAATIASWLGGSKPTGS